MDYELGNRLDLILSNQKALEAQIKELTEKVNALLLWIGKPEGKGPEIKKAVQTGDLPEDKPEKKQGEVIKPELSKHAPSGGKWKDVE